MFHLIAVLNMLNSTMVAIKPCTAFLGINISRKQYIPFTSLEFSSCGTIKPNVFICSNIQIRYNYGSDVCACEINLFNNRTTPTCILEKTDVRWIPLNKENQWIYATSPSSKATAVCNREIIPIALKGSGLLSLNPECMLKHDFVTMNGRQVISSTVRSSYTSLGKISELSLPNNITSSIHNNHSISTYLEDIYTKNIKELSNLQRSLKEENIMELNPTHQLHSHVIGYLALCLSMITLITILLRQRRRAAKTVENTEEIIELQPTGLQTNIVTPIPMPRHKFVLDV